MAENTDLPGQGRRSARARWPWVVGGVAVFTVLVAVAASLLVGWVIEAIFRGRDVGPDAEQMAEDPLLNLELEGADADSIHSRTGREGGVMPAMENPDSEASRVWQLQTGDWEPVLADVMDSATALDVTFWRLRCLPSSIAYSGVKPVAIGDDVEIMNVTIRMSPTETPPRLRITLTSSETDLDPDEPPDWIDDQVEGDCSEDLVPPGLAAT